MSQENVMKDFEGAGDIQSGLLLTPEGYKSLHDELEHLTVVKRPEIANRIRESLEHGEFSEDNSELDEVKFEQAMVESRIAELKGIFGTAQIMDPNGIPTDRVGLGSKVKMEDLQFGDTFTIQIVASIEADPDQDRVSNESPLGTAVWAQPKGQVIEFEAPEGRKKFKVIDISR